MTGRCDGVSSGASFCSGKHAEVGEQTCTAAPLSTMIATVLSVLRSVRALGATNSSSTFTEETACACCKFGGCCVYSCGCWSGNHCCSCCNASCKLMYPQDESVLYRPSCDQTR